MIERFTKDTTSKHEPTIGTSRSVKVVRLKSGDEITMGLFDTGCIQKFEGALGNIRNVFHNRVQGCVIMYDITDIHSFTSVEKKWLPEIRDPCYDWSHTLILVGSKLGVCL